MDQKPDNGPQSKHVLLRRALVALWFLLASTALYLFFFHRELLQGELERAASFSMIAGSLVYLVFGCLRGFTLIPSTTLLVAAIPFFPPAWLLAITLVGILVSSASIYFFAEWLRLDELIARKHEYRLHQLQAALTRFELPVIIGWSFFPLAPTDLICYLCGVLRVDFRKFLLGVAIGEGAVCALYIFLGDFALRVFHFKV